jgi:hypothetical protein
MIPPLVLECWVSDVITFASVAAVRSKDEYGAELLRVSLFTG